MYILPQLTAAKTNRSVRLEGVLNCRGARGSRGVSLPIFFCKAEESKCMVVLFLSESIVYIAAAKRCKPGTVVDDLCACVNP
jgi:hypothetical protein